MKSLHRVVLAVGVAIASLPAIGQAQTWTNWTSGSADLVSGTMGALGVSATGAFYGYQLSDPNPTPATQTPTFVPNYGAGRTTFDFWNPSGAFTQNGLVAPPAFGLIQFKDAGMVTITFSAPVLNPLFAINSLGNTSRLDNVPVGLAWLTFGGVGTSVSLLSSDNGGVDTYWGKGSCSLAGNVLEGSECSGVVQLNGTFSSVTLSGTAENWYGVTVGKASVVPEPSTYALMGLGLAGLGIVARRRKRSV